MTTGTYPLDSDNRVFVLSAIGSACIHAALLAGLLYVPSSPPIPENIPTVQVTLLSAPQQVSPMVPPVTEPLTPAPPEPPSPRPQSKPVPTTSAPPVQASLKPPPSLPTVPAPSPQTRPVLKDVRTDQALKSRQMMKMAMPQQPAQTPSMTPAMPRQESLAANVPVHLNRQPSPRRPTLPPPPRSTALPALKANIPTANGSSISKPTIISSSKPLYPRVARESGWEGTVIIRTLVTPEGLPSQVEVRKSCGHEPLDLAAQEAIKGWRFHPAKDGNIPIAKWVDIPVKFDLNG